MISSTADVPEDWNSPPPTFSHVTVWVTSVPYTVAVKTIVVGQLLRVTVKAGVETETPVTFGGLAVGAVGDKIVTD
ncbi:MAG: hypothetical protein A2758_02175 [Candidatus Zambryskibacteria bacterium RIFCSPHIGHO2_01_FULL_49_18]|uniref:Uncharacterized protein n=2 Tax=Candidatus Zambryskiibacteriota TaxID=1817925 RepID=A0A1G2T3T4_9BACT|nr:MAG: hypothetical protein A2758_02175 [Candidatus Zambryskibacteria bacterium RIFCSPHIGHO2_01_FULL_49_18]OHB06132.1 MAG: hypothetical protein A3A26_01135 [Candidatus Zambryskibacteria bacterium RIFCSPLOWO2_01_FULL_47_14]